MNDPSPRRRVIYRGLKIDLALQSVPLADGTHADREVVVHRGAVALVPMVDDQHVCLVENHRYAVGKTLLEVPAGTIDPGESPEQTAERELQEETGYRAGRDPPDSRVVRIAGRDDRADVSLPLRGPRAGPARPRARRAARDRRSSPGRRPSPWSTTAGSRTPRRCSHSRSADRLRDGIDRPSLVPRGLTPWKGTLLGTKTESDRLTPGRGCMIVVEIEVRVERADVPGVEPADAAVAEEHVLTPAAVIGAVAVADRQEVLVVGLVGDHGDLRRMHDSSGPA